MGWGFSPPAISDGRRCSVQVQEAERLLLLVGFVPFGCPVHRITLQWAQPSLPEECALSCQDLISSCGNKKEKS